MTVAPTSNTGAANNNAATSPTAAAQLTSNQFLSLLTTQLQNQDPLNPTDPNQFTQEMVQYGALSQQIDTNATLSQILTQVSLLASNTAAA